MVTVYESMKTILLFMVVVLIAQTIAGDKFTENMVLVILFSMLILNSEKSVAFFTAVTNNLTSKT